MGACSCHLWVKRFACELSVAASMKPSRGVFTQPELGHPQEQETRGISWGKIRQAPAGLALLPDLAKGVLAQAQVGAPADHPALQHLRPFGRGSTEPAHGILPSAPPPSRRSPATGQSPGSWNYLERHQFICGTLPSGTTARWGPP